METLHGLTIDKLPKFILGGTANFILNDVNTGDHIEFKVKKDTKKENIYWVRYKSIDWIYIGYVDTSTISVKEPLFYKAKGVVGIDEKSEIFRLFILYVFHLRKLPSNIEVLYTGVCSMCGRKLTDPIYIEIGIGKICLTK